MDALAEKKKPLTRYPKEFKLKAVERSIKKEGGGVAAIAKQLGIPHRTLSQWRSAFASELIKSGSASGAKFIHPRVGKRLLSQEQELAFAAWYRDTEAPIPLSRVLSKLDDIQPSMFDLPENDDIVGRQDRAKSWLFRLLRRHGIDNKAQMKPVRHPQPAAAALETGREI